MSIRKTIMLGVSMLSLTLATSTAALAGPCTDQIIELGRKVSNSAALGPVTTGTLTGSGPGSTPAPGTTAGTPQPGAPAPTGTSADNRVGGTAGTKEVNAAVGNLVATSPQDVRRQQEGLPTAAAAAAAGSGRSVETTPGQAGSTSANTASPNDRMSQAKMELEHARMLDQKDDASCRASVDKVRQLTN